MEHLICHHEIPADDPKRAAAFYAKVFNWKIEESSIGEACSYFIFSTGDRGMGGGIFKKCPEYNQPCNYIAVEDIPTACSLIEKEGGRVLLGKTQIPGYGFMAMCADTEGNVFGIWSRD